MTKIEKDFFPMPSMEITVLLNSYKHDFTYIFHMYFFISLNY